MFEIWHLDFCRLQIIDVTCKFIANKIEYLCVCVGFLNSGLITRDMVQFKSFSLLWIEVTASLTSSIL